MSSGSEKASVVDFFKVEIEIWGPSIQGFGSGLVAASQGDACSHQSTHAHSLADQPHLSFLSNVHLSTLSNQEQR